VYLGAGVVGEHSHIGWTDGTWNPWYGCTKISPGCKFCYMYREMQRYGRDPFTVQRSKTTFSAPLTWKEPRMVFTCSWSDFFIEAADQWRDEVWDIIRRTPQHTYQILTKRPELIQDRLPKDWGLGYPNVQLGVSVESPEYEHRIERLLHIYAATRFVSLEPLLAPINIGPWLSKIQVTPVLRTELLHWVIVGGESGAERRECEPAWIMDIVDSCRRFETPVFVKQDSAAKSGQQGRIPDEYWVHEFPAALAA
jgi:protein gp37